MQLALKLCLGMYFENVAIKKSNILYSFSAYELTREIRTLSEFDCWKYCYFKLIALSVRHNILYFKCYSFGQTPQ